MTLKTGYRVVSAIIHFLTGRYLYHTPVNWLLLALETGYRVVTDIINRLPGCD